MSTTWTIQRYADSTQAVNDVVVLTGTLAARKAMLAAVTAMAAGSTSDALARATAIGLRTLQYERFSEYTIHLDPTDIYSKTYVRVVATNSTYLI